MNKRQEVISKEIQNQLGDIFREEYPGNIISVYDVVTSEDLKSAKIWIKIIGDPKIFNRIKKDKDKLRFRLASILKLKHAPDLEFYFLVEPENKPAPYRVYSQTEIKSFINDDQIKANTK